MADVRDAEIRVDRALREALTAANAKVEELERVWEWMRVHGVRIEPVFLQSGATRFIATTVCSQSSGAVFHPLAAVRALMQQVEQSKEGDA